MVFHTPTTLGGYFLLNTRLMMLMFGTLLAGYTIEHFPPSFFRAVRSFWGQFFTFTLISASLVGINFQKREFNLIPIFLSSFLFTIFVRALEKYYEVEDKSVKKH